MNRHTIHDHSISAFYMIPYLSKFDFNQDCLRKPTKLASYEEQAKTHDQKYQLVLGQYLRYKKLVILSIILSKKLYGSVEINRSNNKM